VAFTTYPEKYLDYNSQASKTVAVAVEIPGVDLLTSAGIFTRIRYGDANTFYGQEGIIYGGLRRVSNTQEILTFQGSTISINQTIEPEQGRASISVMSFSFVDYLGYMTKVISPGVIINEILGKPIRCFLGYQDTSFPEDYFTIFRGYVTGVQTSPGIVMLQCSDTAIKQRSQIFKTSTTALTGSVLSTDLTLPVADTSKLYSGVVGPDGGYDSSVKYFVQIDKEWIEYNGNTTLNPVSLTVPVGGRGVLDTVAANHLVAAKINNAIQLTDVGITLALKIMLSGWGAPYLTGVTPVRGLNQTGDFNLGIAGSIPNSITFLTYDAVNDLGLSVGDYLTISGSTVGNNGTVRVTDFMDLADLPNHIVLCDTVFNVEFEPPGVQLALRSQYDTLPKIAGLKLTPQDVDVETFQLIRSAYSASDFLQIFSKEPQSGKTILEQQVYLPLGMYPVTRFGKWSLNITKPPIADQRLSFLDKDNILQPQSITVSRAVNTRRFFNEIKYQYDGQPDGSFLSTLRLLDTTSLNVFGISSVLPVNAASLKTDLGGAVIANRRGRFLLNRYKNAAFELKLKVNWESGSTIETGDTVAVDDQGDLQIPNFSNGERDIGVQLFEVINRSFNISDASVNLTLLSNPGFDITDRYATVSPGSTVVSGTASQVKIKDSYGPLYPLNEPKKWKDYTNQTVAVHSADYSVYEETTFVSQDSADPYKMNLSPPLSFIPSLGMIIDIQKYPTSPNPTAAQIYKNIHAFIAPTVLVETGISTTHLTVSAGDASKFFVGFLIYIHNSDFTIFSSEVKIVSITGTTIAVDTAFGFIPAPGQMIELIGFPDNKGPYRIF